jgi:hypothetical protein
VTLSFHNKRRYLENNMTIDDSTARKGILYLLFAIPKDVARYYRTPAELTDLLKRGGASVRKSIQ